MARALVTDPKIILADEPTGNLDSKSGNDVMELLSELHSLGATIIMVTHSAYDAKFSSRIITLKDGVIISESTNDSKIDVLLEKTIASLSGGEKQRVAIARGVLMQREIWLMDEPTSALDPVGRDHIIQLIEKSSLICISVSHDPVWLTSATHVHTMSLSKDECNV